MTTGPGGPISSRSIDADDFIAVWETVAWQPVFEESFLRARRVSAHGTLLTDPFIVASSEIDDPRDPRVAVLDSSRVVVVWVDDSSDGSDDSGSSIQARYFTTEGMPLGARFQVNTTTLLTQWDPDIAMTAEGDFVVVWRDTTYATRGRIFRLPMLADGFESGDTTAWSAAGP